MREILFRGKRLDNGEWAEGYLGQDTIIGNGKTWLGYVIKPIPKKLWDCGWFEIDPATIGQYTGLKDKHGKRIFEGDVIQIRFEGDSIPPSAPDVWYANAVVVLSDEFHGWYVSYVDGGEMPLWEYDDVDGVVIIGNIHDNPELIGGGEDDLHLSE